MKATRSPVLALLLSVALSGCVDQTGAIDDRGHNGFDRQTCVDYVTFAKDLKLGMLTKAQAADRAHQLNTESAKAGAAVIRQAAADLDTAYTGGSVAMEATALAAFNTACMF